MKIITMLAVSISVLSLKAAYPTMQETECLFSPEKVSSTNMHYYTNGEYRRFLNQLSEAADDTVRRAVETYVISSVTSFVFCVSTNKMNDGVQYWLLQDRGISFAQFAFCCKDLATNTNNCFALARYASTIHGVEFPNDLVFRRISVSGFADEMTADFNQKMDAFYERKALQTRVYQANRSVADYRGRILSMCNYTVRSLNGKLSGEDYSAFTNRLVQLSCADEDEKRRLFRGLK